MSVEVVSPENKVLVPSGDIVRLAVSPGDPELIELAGFVEAELDKTILNNLDVIRQSIGKFATMPLVTKRWDFDRSTKLYNIEKAQVALANLEQDPPVIDTDTRSAVLRYTDLMLDDSPLNDSVFEIPTKLADKLIRHYRHKISRLQ